MTVEFLSAQQRLSKSRFVAGLQCHKQLWWVVHEPTAPELQWDGQIQTLMQRGTRVGEIARGHIPGGILIDLPHNAYAERIARTKEAVQSNCEAIYEASFDGAGVYTAIDILKRENGGFRLIEVKSSTSVKDHHIPDIAVQAYVLRQNGLNVTSAELMHLNRECTYPDLSNLFTRADVTEAARSFEQRVPDLISKQLEMLKASIPNVSTGSHCTTPYDCPFLDRCWSPLPAHHVSTLYSMKRRALELDEQGYRTIFDLPDDVTLGTIADRQRRAVREGRMIVEPTLAEALKTFVEPIAFIDFETVALPVPIWDGCHPYDPVPAQFSCYLKQPSGSTTAYSWISEPGVDPRPALGQQLINACRTARTIVAYNANFERRCLELMSKALPSLATELKSISDRLQDMLPVVRNNLYHPDFHGSFGLKSVLPALVPSVNYEGLSVPDGITASFQLERLLFSDENLTTEEQKTLRNDLTQYCQQDTFGLYSILEYLRRL